MPSITEDRDNVAAHHGDGTNGYGKMPSGTDIFNDLSQCAVDQSFEASAIVQELVTIHVRTPRKREWVRSHPDPAYRQDMTLLELKEEDIQYFVHPRIRDHIGKMCGPTILTNRELVLAITRQGDPFLWKLGMPDDMGRLNPWHRSARKAEERAREQWVRVVSNKNISGYNVYTPLGAFPDPQWPDESLSDLLKIAFDGCIIESIDHPAIEHLRGKG